MKLEKLTEKNVDLIYDRKIYLVRYFHSYIEELYKSFPALPFIQGVIDSDPAKQGEKDFNGCRIPVYGIEKVRELPEDAILIITTGYFREEYEMLQEAALPKTVGDTIYYYANQDTEYYECYLDSYAGIPLKDLIVFRSGMGTWEHVAGMDYTENARALFEYMLAEGYNRKYEMVWLVKFPELYRDVEQRNVNVHFVSYDWATSADKGERDAYYRVVCLAKFFFFTHACGFCRLPREGQVRVQLWHGCGFKTVKNTTPQAKRYEYTTVVSRLYAGIHEKEFGLLPSQILVTGYAKEDWLFHPVPQWKNCLGIPDAGRYIFWLPTFRKAQNVVSYMDIRETGTETGLSILNTIEKLKEANRFLQEKDMVLIIKLHPLQKREDLFHGEYSNILLLENETLAKADLHINQILGHADALVSDYSSAAIDFLLLDRPIAFTLDDLEEYEQSRGFVLNPIQEWIPGEKIFTFDKFMDFMGEVAEGEDTAGEERRRLIGKLHDFHDDGSCRRITAALGL